MNAPELEVLIKYLARLPGLGPRSARRVALHLIKNKDAIMLPLAGALKDTAENIKTCSECGNVSLSDPCPVCADAARDRATLCIVEDVADLWAVERTRMYKGLYHVLGGTLSALDGVGPDQLNMSPLFQRVKAQGITEVIIATNATVEGQTTAHYIMEKLTPTGVSLTRLAHGVPLGGELDYLDDGTLTAAFSARRPF